MNKPIRQQVREVAEVLPETVYESGRFSIGGIAEAMGEHWGIEAADRWGQGLREEAGAELDKLAIRDPTFGQQAVLSGLQSAGQALPLMVAAYATRSPHIVTSGFGLMEFGRAYGTARQKGIDPDKSVKYAAASGLVEFGTELLPTKYLFGKSPSLLGRAARFFGSEIVGEETAEVSQRYLEWWGGLEEKPTVGELKEIMALTAVATPIGGATQFTVSRALDNLDRAAREVIGKKRGTLAERYGQKDKARLSAVLNSQIVGEGWWTSRSVSALTSKIQRRKDAPRSVWENELKKAGVKPEELMWLQLNNAQKLTDPEADSVPIGSMTDKEFDEALKRKAAERERLEREGMNADPTLSYEQVLSYAISADVGLETLILDATDDDVFAAEDARLQAKNRRHDAAQRLHTWVELTGGGMGLIQQRAPQYLEDLRETHGDGVSGLGGDIKELVLTVRQALADSINPEMHAVAVGIREVMSAREGRKVPLKEALNLVRETPARQQAELAAEHLEWWVNHYGLRDMGMDYPTLAEFKQMMDEKDQLATAVSNANMARPSWTGWMVPGDKVKAVNLLAVMDKNSLLNPDNNIFLGHEFDLDSFYPFESQQQDQTMQSGDANILVWVRGSIRHDPLTNEKFFFIEEIQSDWHQRARKHRDDYIFNEAVYNLRNEYDSDEAAKSYGFQPRKDWKKLVNDYRKGKINGFDVMQSELAADIAVWTGISAKYDAEDANADLTTIADETIAAFGAAAAKVAKDLPAFFGYADVPGGAVKADMGIPDSLEDNISNLGWAENSFAGSAKTSMDEAKTAKAPIFYGALASEPTLESYIEKLKGHLMRDDQSLNSYYGDDKTDGRLVLEMYVKALETSLLDVPNSRVAMEEWRKAHPGENEPEHHRVYIKALPRTVWHGSPDAMDPDNELAGTSKWLPQKAANNVIAFYKAIGHIRAQTEEANRLYKQLEEVMGDRLETRYITRTDGEYPYSYNLTAKISTSSGSTHTIHGRGFTGNIEQLNRDYFGIRHSAHKMAEAIGALRESRERWVGSHYPFAPWIETWTEKGIDQAIKYAVSQGLNRIAVATGKEAGDASGFPESGWPVYDEAIPNKLRKKLGKNSRNDVAVDTGSTTDSDKWDDIETQISNLSMHQERLVHFGQDFTNHEQLQNSAQSPQQYLFRHIMANEVTPTVALNLQTNSKMNRFTGVHDTMVFMWDRKASPGTLALMTTTKDIRDAIDAFGDEQVATTTGQVNRLAWLSINTEATEDWIKGLRSTPPGPTNTGFTISPEKIAEYSRPLFKFMRQAVAKGPAKTREDVRQYRPMDAMEFGPVERALGQLPPVIQSLPETVGVTTGEDGLIAEWDRKHSQLSIAEDVLKSGNQKALVMSLAHELFHGLDTIRGLNYNGFSNDSELFDMELGDIHFDLATDRLSLRGSGEVIQEMFREWDRSEGMDHPLDYPFLTYLQELASYAEGERLGILKPADIKKAQELILEFQAEAAAQAFGIFYANPDTLKDMPNTRAWLEKLDRDLRSSETKDQAGRRVQESLWADTDNSDPSGRKLLDAAGQASDQQRRASPRVGKGTEAGRQQLRNVLKQKKLTLEQTFKLSGFAKDISYIALRGQGREPGSDLLGQLFNISNPTLRDDLAKELGRDDLTTDMMRDARRQLYDITQAVWRQSELNVDGMVSVHRGGPLRHAVIPVTTDYNVGGNFARHSKNQRIHGEYQVPVEHILVDINAIATALQNTAMDNFTYQWRNESELLVRTAQMQLSEMHTRPNVGVRAKTSEDPLITWETVPAFDSQEGAIFQSLDPILQHSFIHDARKIIFPEVSNEEQAKRAHKMGMSTAQMRRMDPGLRYNDLLAEKLGVPKRLANTANTKGVYEGAATEAFATGMLQLGEDVPWPQSLAYAEALQLIFKQNEVYITQPLKGDVDVDAEGHTAAVVFDISSLFEVGKFSEAMTKKFGEGVGYTVVGDYLLVTNFFEADNDAFIRKMHDIWAQQDDLGLVGIQALGARSEQGQKIEWGTARENDQRTRVETQLASRAGVAPDILSWIADRRAEFEALARDFEAQQEHRNEQQAELDELSESKNFSGVATQAEKIQKASDKLALTIKKWEDQNG